MKHISRTYTLAAARKLLNRGFQRDGIPVDEELVSSEGMSFTMIQFPETTFQQLKKVESWYKRQRDVVGSIYISELETCPNCGAPESAVGFYLDGGEDGYDMICNGCNNPWTSENWHSKEDYGSEH